MNSLGYRFGVTLILALLTAGRAGALELVELKLERQLSETAAKRTEGRPLFGAGGQLSERDRREMTMRDGAQLRRAGTVVRADRITYYPQDDEVVAVGAVRVVRDLTVFSGPQLRLKLDAHEGSVQAGRFELPVFGGTGTASTIEFQGPERTRLLDALFTTCDPSNPDWYLHAESLTLDERTQQAQARSASLVFMDRTILGSPSISFPLSGERRSGFLAPSYAVNSRTGLELTAPYYFNIAPNRDLTLLPRVMTRSGVQLGGHLRFMEPRTAGEFKFELTPNDAPTGTTRYLANLQQTFTNVGGWSGLLKVKGVSDDNYFVDYSRSILASSERSLPRSITASRSIGDWTLVVNATGYQNILEARAAPPYERLP
ncbi:MAG: LPS assembly protein LptD, partial [Quisquiliibacterium sp.]